MNKYPNADTSPERLAEIIRSCWNVSMDFAVHGGDPDLPHKMIYDLLAMLQESQTQRQLIQDAFEERSLQLRERDDLITTIKDLAERGEDFAIKKILE